MLALHRPDYGYITTKGMQIVCVHVRVHVHVNLCACVCVRTHLCAFRAIICDFFQRFQPDLRFGHFRPAFWAN